MNTIERHTRGTKTDLGYSRAICEDCGCDWPCPDVAQAREEAQANPAPATDANGNDIWGLWASLPGRHDKEVTVTTDSAVNRSAIGNFLLDEGFTVFAD